MEGRGGTWFDARSGRPPVASVAGHECDLPIDIPVDLSIGSRYSASASTAVAAVDVTVRTWFQAVQRRR